jgi:uncharacterized protein YdhG (YjbR/CyaY superfamily)
MSDAESVDDYVSEALEARRPLLKALRALCLAELAGFEEAMRYGMPTYSRRGVAEIAWASQKQYLSLYVLRTDVLGAHLAQLGDLDLGKGCVRYRRPDQVDLAVVASMLGATAASRGPVC